jgi:hypothetical protein
MEVEGNTIICEGIDIKDHEHEFVESGGIVNSYIDTFHYFFF